MGNYSTKKIIKNFFCFGLAVFFLNSCRRIPEETVSCNIESITLSTNSPIVENKGLNVSVHVDGSGSMKGYAAMSNNNYARTLELISNAIINTDDINVEYHRIGDDTSITRTDFRRDASSPIFYDGSDPKYRPITSPIQEAIKPRPSERDKLTIVVTDLEADDNGQFLEVLTQHYLNQDPDNENYTVGVWAIKSEFSGVVFDPMTGRANVRHQSQVGNIETYRPFYVLFIGKSDHIVKYFNELKRLDSQLQEASEMFIFPTRSIFTEPVNIGTVAYRENNSTLPTDQQFQRVFVLQDHNSVVSLADPQQQPYELLNVVHQDNSEVELNYQVLFPKSVSQNSQFYPLISGDKLKAQTRVFTFSGQNHSTNVDDELLLSSDSPDEVNDFNLQQTEDNFANQKQFFQEDSSTSFQQALNIKDWSLDSNGEKLNFSANVNLSNLSMSQIYLFEVDLILDGFTVPDWWNEWSIPRSDTNVDPTKTEELSVFMNRLKSLSLATLNNEDNNFIVGRLCFGIQQN